MRGGRSKLKVFIGEIVVACSLPQGQGRDKDLNFVHCDQFRLSDEVSFQVIEIFLPDD